MNNENSKILKLYASCFLTKGYQRGLISDVQRGIYYTVPLALIDFIHHFENKDIKSIADYSRSHENKTILEEYLDFLDLNEITFYAPANLKDNFIPIEMSFEFPAKISNAIIEIERIDLPYIKIIFNNLVKVNCYNIGIYILRKIDELDFESLLNLTREFEMNDVGILLTNHLSLDYEAFKSQYPFVTSLAFYSEHEEYEQFYKDLKIKVIASKKALSDRKFCGVITEDYFTLNLSHFTESLHHNTCLNRKISIDAEGNIKNCPSMKESYGNICDTTLEEAINKPGFKKYWDIKKDDITKCKDCEFRHVCTDCRAYLDDPDDLFSAPLKCGYNPYTCEWEDWSTHPLKQQAIDHYNMRQIL